jgi:ABC-type sugar transport system ATPase subunit
LQMSLLELDRVTKRYGRGPAARTALRDVSLQIDAGELVAVWGSRRSGRSTLTRIIAGVTKPDDGVVRLRGYDLADRDGEARRQAIGYCVTVRRPHGSQLVLEQLVTDQLVGGHSVDRAERQAREALIRTSVEFCAAMPLRELDPAEAVRVAIARALSREPSLLVIDEPTLGIDLLARDEILLLLRSLADDGVAVLMTVGDAPSLSAADRALALGEGELRGDVIPQLASVLPLRRSA